MPTALITGITGQDGGYLAERLVADGYDVHGTVRPGDVPGEELNALADAVTLHDADLQDDHGVSGVVAGVSPDELFNLGGLSSVAQSWSEPVLTARINGQAVAVLLEAAFAEAQRRGRDIRFVQASSAEIFAGAGSSPQDEATPLAPTSPYGAAKAFAHLLVGVYRARGMHCSSAILYNHESPRRPAGFVTRKITSTVAAIARGEADTLVLGNLEARRDWGWAPDYVDALALAARAPEPHDYVIATGSGHSVRDFVAAAMQRAGIQDWEPLVRTDPAYERPTDSVELIGDARRARDRLGWQPTVSFEELVGRMVDHDLS